MSQVEVRHHTEEAHEVSSRVRFNSTPDYEKPRERRMSSRRSNSGSSSGGDGPTFMSPLSFEEIDLKNTPLSSLRSCSEYQRQQIEVQLNTAVNARTAPKSFWSRMFGFSSSVAPEPDETAFLMEKMRFNPAMLYEGEEYDPHRHHSSIDGSGVDVPLCFGIPLTISDPDQAHPHTNRRQTYPDPEGQLIKESLSAFDYLFGLPNDGRGPKEIELKSFSEPKYFTPIYTDDLVPFFASHASSRHDLNELHNAQTTEPDSNSNTSNNTAAPSSSSSSLRRNNSLRNLATSAGGETSPQEQNHHHHHIPEMAVTAMTAEIDNGVTHLQLLRALFDKHWTILVAFLRGVFPDGRGEEQFYESIRLQPFASGAYLRCMLLAGLSSMFFQIYNVFTWPRAISAPAEEPQMMMMMMEGSEEQTRWWSYSFEMVLFINLLIQIVLNLLQLPFRLRIHFLCWESSRALEVDQAITIIRGMLASESWLLNKALGKLTDLMILLNLLLTEVYLWFSSREDPLRALMISLCATNMLTIVARVLVATIFSFSMHDPHVLSEARRRGLSKWDLEVLPTFLFSAPEEVNNSDCPICLCSFEQGEMLISLPCDAKHSFHAPCIRQWLQRQNSCPLCNKLV